MATVDPQKRGAFNISEAARYLGVSRTTMYELVRQHKVPSFKVGSRTLIPRVELNRWMIRAAERGEVIEI